MKRITLMLLILTGCKAMAVSQTFYFFEVNKLTGTHYKYPAGVLGAGYQQKLPIKNLKATSEIGLRTNWNEYYTYPYIGSGLLYRGKIIIGVNAGLGIMLSLPMQDRYYNPQTHEISVIKEGYSTKSIGLGYYGGRLGYRIFNVGNDSGVWLYASYNKTGKFEWKGIGLLFTHNN